MKYKESQEERDVSLMAKDQYMREVHRVEPATEEEEAQLLGHIERARRDPTHQGLARLAQQARERLVEVYQPMVIACAYRMARRCHRLEVMDLIQEGNVALLRVIDTCDLWRDCPLSALVAVYVRYALLDALREHNGSVRL